MSDIPVGYIMGLVRDRSPLQPGYYRFKKSHLYKGDMADPGLPMCRNGWNRDGGLSYSIWRNNTSPTGVCEVCLKRARAGLDGIESKKRPDRESEL